MNGLEWAAVYNDGSTFRQYEEDGSENLYVDIDRDRLTHFVLLCNGEMKARIHLNGDKRLIFRKRNFLKGNKQIGQVFLAGWQETVNGANRKMLCFLFPDGHLEILPDFLPHAVFCEIENYRPEEIPTE
jgi:hypothetical protein